MDCSNLIINYLYRVDFMNLYDFHDQVKTKEDFIGFIKVLRKNFQFNQREWETIILGDYLESIVAWLNDNNTLPNKTNWEVFATIFLLGKDYE